MAHFAELDANNVVTRVIVVGNPDCLDENGQESEAVGISFCQQLFGDDTRWVQTSYNGNFRGTYAGIGFTYDEENDEFVAPPPPPDLTALPEPTPEDAQEPEVEEPAN